MSWPEETAPIRSRISSQQHDSTSNKVQTFKAHHRFPPRTSWHRISQMFHRCYPRVIYGAKKTDASWRCVLAAKKHTLVEVAHNFLEAEVIARERRASFWAPRKPPFLLLPRCIFQQVSLNLAFQSLETNTDNAMTQTPFTTFNKYVVLLRLLAQHTIQWTWISGNKAELAWAMFAKLLLLHHLSKQLRSVQPLMLM